MIFRKLVIRIPNPDSPDSETEASFAAASHIETILDLPTLPVLQVLDLKISLGFGAPLPPNLYLAVAALPTAVPAIEVLRLTLNAIWPRLDSLANDDARPLPWFNDAAYREKLLSAVHCRGWPDHTPRGCVDFSTYLHP